MNNKKTLFSIKKGVIYNGTTHEKKSYVQSLGFMVSASFGGNAGYRQVIEAVESKIDGKVSHRNIRGAIKDLNSVYPVEFSGNKQIETIKINRNQLEKQLINNSQSKILRYIYKESEEIKEFISNEFSMNERQFYRLINGEIGISNKKNFFRLAAFISIFLSNDQKFKYYPTFSQKILNNQIGYIFSKTTPLFAINPTLEEILSLSFMMNRDVLIYYYSKICKELDFSGEESYKIIKFLSEKEIKKYKINQMKYLDFFHTMDNNGEFIDPQTIIRTSNLPIDKRIKIVPKIERDIVESLPELFNEMWELSKKNLNILRTEVSKQINSRKSIKRDLLNDKLADYLR
ncbi:MAG: hypothetical protein MK013_02245 [Dehalococcoidia bacterium]|nr:hypothetical protein [Dehalococcoidia bacterium]